MKNKTFTWQLIIASLLGSTAVMLAAVGAHMLKNILTPERLHAFNTATDMQLFHSIVLLVLAFQTQKSSGFRLSYYLILGGILCFSFSIYGLVSGLIYLGPVTPLGGVLLILGWLSLIPAGLRKS